MARHHDLYALLVDAAVRQRDRDVMMKYTPLLEKEIQYLDHSLYQAIAHRAHGVVHHLDGDLEEAKDQLEIAKALFQELDTRWQLGRTLYEMGDLAASRSDTPGAIEHYSASLALFDKIGALPDADKARAALAALNGS